MKYFPQIFSTLLILPIFLLPEIASAQGFLPCSGGPDDPCNSCDIVVVANLLISWLIGAVMVLFAVLLVVAGFGLVTSGGNPSALSDAKSRFTNAFIGLLIVLSAWLIVDTLMRGLIGNNGNIEGYLAWSEVQCTTQVVSSLDPGEVDIDVFWPGDPSSPASATSILSSTMCDPTPNGNRNCTEARNSCAAGTVAQLDDSRGSTHYINCVQSVSSAQVRPSTPAGQCAAGTCGQITIPCGPSAGSNANCTISPDMVDRLEGMQNASNVPGARVTEGYPPRYSGHVSECHSNGTCIDYSRAGGMTSEQVLSVYNAAIANDLRPVYEVVTESRRQELIRAGVPEHAVLSLGSHITAEHFSIYGY